MCEIDPLPGAKGQDALKAFLFLQACFAKVRLQRNRPYGKQWAGKVSKRHHQAIHSLTKATFMTCILCWSGSRAIVLVYKECWTSLNDLLNSEGWSTNENLKKKLLSMSCNYVMPCCMSAEVLWAFKMKVPDHTVSCALRVLDSEF